MSTTKEDIEAFYASLAARTANPIPTRRHVMDVINPGTSRPESHGGPGSLSVDQTMSTSMSSSSANISNGELQRLDLLPLQGGVTVTEEGRKIPRDFNGQFQHRNYKPLDQGTHTDTASPHLPVSVDVAAQNLHHPSIGTTFELPPARDVKADDKRPGGLPTSHAIK